MELGRGFRQRATLHNARVGLFLKILYPYFPLYGEDYEVFGGAGGKRDMVYVRLADQTTRGVPAWMFDPAVCEGVRLAEESIIDCEALLRLAQLLDSLEADARSAGHEPTKGTETDDDIPSKP